VQESAAQNSKVGHEQDSSRHAAESDMDTCERFGTRVSRKGGQRGGDFLSLSLKQELIIGNLNTQQYQMIYFLPYTFAWLQRKHLVLFRFQL
jgi:hypothetical protein